MLTIYKLPDGRCTLSKEPSRALSEGELREQLGLLKAPAWLVQDLIHLLRTLPI